MESVVSGVGVLDKAMHLLDVVEYSQPVSFLDLVEASASRRLPSTGSSPRWRCTASCAGTTAVGW